MLLLISKQFAARREIREFRGLFLSLFLGVFLLPACSNYQSDTLFQSQSRKPVMHGEYVVQQGDSLYSIAWRYKRDYKELARLNGINPPYVIKVGQKIDLAVVGDEIPSKSGYTGQTIVKQSSPPKSSNSRQTAKPEKRSGLSIIKNIPRFVTGRLKWMWPANGKIIQSFSSSSVGKKGIQIAGKAGDPILAASAGQVVYSGNSLVGYGNLVIVKHNETYLTAYAHNQRVLVKEGDSVQQGQKIAEMGSSGTDRDKLHFEIRKEGRPVNPLSYLPKKR